MNSKEPEKSDYRLVKTPTSDRVIFIDLQDEDAVSRLKNQPQNTCPLISICSYDEPELSAARRYPLYFKFESNDPQKAHRSALEACYWINEYCNIREDCIEAHYSGSGYGDNKRYGNNDNGINANSKDSNIDVRGGAAAVEIIIFIPAIVFSSFPSLLIPAINYNLAWQMVTDGIDVDIDVYYRDYCIALPNSIHNHRYVIPLTVKELLNLDIAAVNELAKSPRPENSMIIPRRVPAAVEWFAQIHKQAEKDHIRQQQLLNIMLQSGWQIPYCLRYLLWKELGENNGLEACRITGRFYAAINANEEELWNHILRWAQRNAYVDYQRLKAIISFALENPCLCDCDHPLLRRFCPTGGCFMKELVEEYEKPHLFANIR